MLWSRQLTHEASLGVAAPFHAVAIAGRTNGSGLSYATDKRHHSTPTLPLDVRVPSPLAGDSSMQVRYQDTGTIKAKGYELCLKHGIQARHTVYPLSSLKLRAHSNHIALSSGLDTCLLQILCLPCKREPLNRPYQQPAFMCVCGGIQASSYMSKCICMCVHVEANGQS